METRTGKQVFRKTQPSLNRTMQYGNTNGVNNSKIYNKFKSYYVVWKPCCAISARRILKCLNRTMQYGNCFGKKIQSYCCCPFKSYYVVWKLDLVKMTSDNSQQV